MPRYAYIHYLFIWQLKCSEGRTWLLVNGVPGISGPVWITPIITLPHITKHTTRQKSVLKTQDYRLKYQAIGAGMPYCTAPLWNQMYPASNARDSKYSTILPVDQLRKRRLAIKEMSPRWASPPHGGLFFLIFAQPVTFHCDGWPRYRTEQASSWTLHTATIIS